jgi:RNA polymerase sigma-70 factor (ECF subfamily)
MSFADEVHALRPQLLRFAQLQLRNATWAEDVVSETIVAALERPEAFGGRSQLKTWLIGILKFKVLDCLRAQAREPQLAAQSPAGDDDDDGGIDLIDALGFAADGHFLAPLRDWGDPESYVTERQFLAVLEACTEQLPARLGRVLLMREWLELSSDEICKELGVTATNLWVMLHRARLRLRECLDLNWFSRC